MLTPGERIGDWVVRATLGEGGMGAVYRCDNALVDDIHAAVKVLKPHSIDDARERFFREVRAVFRLRHPNVVRVLGFGEDADRRLLWMAMDLVTGTDLNALIEAGPMNPAAARDLVAGVADGLAHAHEQGIFHRDIKPANILVDSATGRGMLVDFGIAVSEGEARLTRTGLVVGTPAYMAPEAFEGADVGPAAADIYALGQVLYELLRGGRAFPEDPNLSSGQVIVQLIGKKLAADELDPGDAVPEPIRGAVRAATATDPGDRLPSVAALRDRLRGGGGPAPAAEPTLEVEAALVDPDTVKVAEAEPPAPRPATKGARQRPRARRRQKRSSLGGCVAVAVILLLVAVGATVVALVVTGFFGLAILGAALDTGAGAVPTYEPSPSLPDIAQDTDAPSNPAAATPAPAPAPAPARDLAVVCTKEWPTVTAPSADLTRQCKEWWLAAVFADPSAASPSSNTYAGELVASDVGADALQSAASHVADACGFACDGRDAALFEWLSHQADARRSVIDAFNNVSFDPLLGMIALGQPLDVDAVLPGGLCVWSPSTLSRLRNTAFARHGRSFSNPDLDRFFYGSDTPAAFASFVLPLQRKSGYSDALLTDVDRANIATLQAAENTCGGAR